MNTKNLKAYAPKARREFIAAVKKRAAHFGIYEDRVEEVRIEGGAAIIEGRAFTRKEGEQRKRLESKVLERGYDMFIREMAYTWFNRLAAIRYMELHDYFDHGFRVLSPAKSNTSNPDGLPEILSHASDVADSLDLDKSHIIELQLAGDKEEELYRELLLGQCHQLAKIMPFVFKGIGFEVIDDATELLLPNNLTKTDSILKGLINDIPEEDWQQIEVIGWLYQFYISEHKDAVIGKVVKSEDIPAATQLFTPNWIVKYLVQNSVGRQWLATYPDSELKSKMEYYIEPAEQSDEVIEQLKAITPTSIDPEEIKVLDPACGSGHILVEVYEVLREIYLERGYRLREIPELILTKNIYGLDIDDRAAQLAGFALMMKAREDDRRIFQRVEEGEVSLNVFSLQSTEGLDIATIWKGLDLEGNQQIGSTGGLFDESDDFVQPTGIYKDYLELLQMLKSTFLQAKTIGSLIQVENQNLSQLSLLREKINEKFNSGDPAAKQAAVELLPIINQAICLAMQYDAVVANPPYMGGNGMNSELKEFAKSVYKFSKTDLFSIYIEKCLAFTKANGDVGMVTPYVWMFITSYAKLRELLLSSNTLTSLIQLEYNAFAPACIPVCTFTFRKAAVPNHISSFIKLSEFKGHENQAPKTLEAIKDRSCGWFYEANPDHFKQIQGTPIAYWSSKDIFNAFNQGTPLVELTSPKTGMRTGDNERFLRQWHEVSYAQLATGSSNIEEFESTTASWAPYQKGGSYRKWYGNKNLVVYWKNNGYAIKENTLANYPQLSWDNMSWKISNESEYFKESISWSDITSSDVSSRYNEQGSIFDTTGPCYTQFGNINKYFLLGYMNSDFCNEVVQLINPTLHFTIGDAKTLPIPHSSENEKIINLVKQAIEISKYDWDLFERSWNYKQNVLLKFNQKQIKNAYEDYTADSESNTKKLENIENQINILIKETLDFTYIDSSPVRQSKVSLTTNPYYRFSASDAISERFCSETLSELVSYSIGCMMGRYSLDRDGLVYAHAGNEDFKELEADGAYKTFPADDDGIIPLASEEWLFDDDATTRFKEFVKTVWGEEHLTENLDFVAESLCLHAIKPLKGNKGQGEGAMDTIRRYFSTQFFKDHCKTYKKRPIYWLFSSGKEKAFECLVYLHRYNEGTLSRMRTEYVTPLMGKYDAQLARLSDDIVNATGSEARRIEKDIKALEKKQAELRTFDEQLKHYAEKRITLDLDDGVKENYGKFGNLLADVKNIHGKAVK